MKFEEIPRLIQDSGKLIKEHMPKSNDLELIILKGHILLEYLLNQIINIKSEYNLEIESTNFSFNQKIEILVILNIIENNSDIFQILKIWNNLRNQIAHRLYFDRKLVDRLIKLGVKWTKGENHLPNSDNERAKALKFLIPMTSGHLTGQLAGSEYKKSVS
jgi:hypothetical protein